MRGAGGFCCVAIEQYAVEGQQSVGSAVDASAPVAERLSDAAACEGRLLVTMPETVEASADELAPHSGLSDRRFLLLVMERPITARG